MEPCLKCPSPRRRGGRWCLAHHAAYQRLHRPKHRDLPPLARRKANARAYLKVYLRRGRLKRLPCQECQGVPAQGHHPNYDRPLEVVWLCRECHLKEHRRLRSA